MKTIRETIGTQTYFIITELDPAYHQAVQELECQPVVEGFAFIYPANSPHIDRAYQNFERYAEEMILQTARVHLSPWEQALLSFLEIVKGQNIDWWLVGSTALAVRGIDISPRDIDISVANADSLRLGSLLLDYLVQPVQAAENWFCNWFGRAFLHMRLEWVGGVDERADAPEISDFGPAAKSRQETVKWHGYDLQIPPLDLQLKANEERGLTDRIDKIKIFSKLAFTNNQGLESL
jgi:hypothetical protein